MNFWGIWLTWYVNTALVLTDMGMPFFFSCVVLSNCILMQTDWNINVIAYTNPWSDGVHGRCQNQWGWKPQSTMMAAFPLQPVKGWITEPFLPGRTILGQHPSHPPVAVSKMHFGYLGIVLVQWYYINRLRKLRVPKSLHTTRTTIG